MSYNGGVSFTGDKKLARRALDEALKLANMVAVQKQTAGLASLEKVYDIEGGTVRVVDNEHVRHLYIDIPPTPVEEEEEVEEEDKFFERGVFVLYVCYGAQQGSTGAAVAASIKPVWAAPPAIDTNVAAVALTTTGEVVAAGRDLLRDMYDYGWSNSRLSLDHANNMATLDWIGPTGIRLYIFSRTPVSKYTQDLNNFYTYTTEQRILMCKGRQVISAGTVSAYLPFGEYIIGFGILESKLIYIHSKSHSTLVTPHANNPTWFLSNAVIKAVDITIDALNRITVLPGVQTVGTFAQSRSDYGLAVDGAETVDDYNCGIGSTFFCFSPDGTKAVRNRAFPGISETTTNATSTSDPYSNYIETVTATHNISFKEELTFSINSITNLVEFTRTKTQNPSGPIMVSTDLTNAAISTTLSSTKTEDMGPGDLYRQSSTYSETDYRSYITRLDGNLSEVLAYDYDWNNELVVARLNYLEAESEYIRNDSGYGDAEYGMIVNSNVLLPDTDAGSGTENRYANENMTHSGRFKTELLIESVAGGGVEFITIPFHDYDDPGSSSTYTGTVRFTADDSPDQFTDYTSTGYRTTVEGPIVSTMRQDQVLAMQHGVVCMDLRNNIVVMTHCKESRSFTQEYNYWGHGTGSVSSGNTIPEGSPEDNYTGGTRTWEEEVSWDPEETELRERVDILYVRGNPLVLPQTVGVDGKPTYNAIYNNPIETTSPWRYENAIANVMKWYTSGPTIGNNISIQASNVLATSDTLPYDIIFMGQILGVFGGSVAVDRVSGDVVAIVHSGDYRDVDAAAPNTNARQGYACSQAVYYYSVSSGEVVSLQERMWPGHDTKLHFPVNLNLYPGTDYGFAGQVEFAGVIDERNLGLFEDVTP